MSSQPNQSNDDCRCLTCTLGEGEGMKCPTNLKESLDLLYSSGCHMTPCSLKTCCAYYPLATNTQRKATAEGRVLKYAGLVYVFLKAKSPEPLYPHINMV